MIFAHVLPGDAGAIQGFLHPLLGLEHLIAMLAVGLLSAQIGGRAIWTVPLTFVSVMVVGGILGLTDIELPFVDYGIAISVVILGVALLIQRSRLTQVGDTNKPPSKTRLAEVVAIIFVALFAIFHGYAHGEAVPPDQNFAFLVAYVVGFFVSTAGLHVIGALIGYISLRSQRGTLILRAMGAIIAIIGVIFFLN